MIGKNSLICVHDDEMNACPFCGDESTQENETEASKNYGTPLSKKDRKRADKIAKYELEPPVNRLTGRVVDQVIDVIKETEWPEWAEPEDWRMVAVNAIEKHFGRL